MAMSMEKSIENSRLFLLAAAVDAATEQGTINARKLLPIEDRIGYFIGIFKRYIETGNYQCEPNPADKILKERDFKILEATLEEIRSCATSNDDWQQYITFLANNALKVLTNAR